MNYLTLGAVSLKVSNRHLAAWGFPVLQIGGLSIWCRHNDGALGLISYHPRSSLTWLWGLSFRPATFSFRPRWARSVYGRGGGYFLASWLGLGANWHWQRRMPRIPA